MVQNVTDRLKHYFEPTLVYPVMGNHDYDPVNQLPTAPSPMYTALGDMWQEWIGVEAADMFKTGSIMKRNKV